MVAVSATPDPSDHWSERRVRGIRRGLLAFYDRDGRRLPWRAAPGERASPYPVLVSETMLQQTRAATVIPYYGAFLARFPRLEDLAGADEADVLHQWQGLGYYRRAKHLHAAARAVVDEHGGAFPRTAADLRALPGVGPYTAGAIASISFGERVPAVDGNAARVLARLFPVEEPVDDAAVRKRIWRLAEALVPPTRPGDFNQAVMELGATVCTARRPRCPMCPVRSHCAAVAAGRADELPKRRRAKPPKRVTHQIVALEGRAGLLFTRRPETGLWASLWQLPTWEDRTTPPTAEEIGRALGLRVEEPSPAGRFDHQTTHRSIRFEVSRARVRGGRLRDETGYWRRPDAADDLALANPQRRALALLAAPPAAAAESAPAYHDAREGRRSGHGER